MPEHLERANEYTPTVARVRPSTAGVSDNELVELALGGDRAAFGELVERHQHVVFRTALGALRSREDAEDVTQDTFVAAFRDLARFRNESSFRTWVLTIAWNRVRDRRRSVARWLRVFTMNGNGDGGLEAIVGDPSSERALVDDEARRLVRTLVGALPPRYRDPLLITVFGGQTFEEAGRVLKIPSGTAKWRAKEARRLLRVRLAAHGYGDPEPKGNP